MRIRRTLGSIVAGALVASPLALVTTVTATETASAADTVETRIVPGSTSGEDMVYNYSGDEIVYGDELNFSVDVEALINGVWTEIYDGTTTVSEQIGTAAPAVIAQETTPYANGTFTAQGNATITFTFNGGTGGYPEYNYAPSTATYSLTGVQRDIGLKFISGKHAGFKLHLKPATKTKVVVSKKHGKKFKTFKKKKTNKKGKVTFILPAPKKGKFTWNIHVKGGGSFSTTDHKIVTYKGFGRIAAR